MTASGDAGEPAGEAGDPARGGRARAGFIAVLAAAGLLAAAGVLTHDEVRATGLAAADKQLMRMQRMGPPPNLQPAYQQLSADTVPVRSAATGTSLAAGTYVGNVTVNPALPGYASILPGGVQRVLRTLKGPAYAAVFVTPIVPGLSGKVTVTLAGKELPGFVSYRNPGMDLAAVQVPVTQDEQGKLGGPPEYSRPLSQPQLTLGRLILYRGPRERRGTGFVLTSGTLRAAGRSSCGASLSGASPGSPVGWISPTGTLVLAGLAVPADPAGECQLIGSWLIEPFLHLMVAHETDTGAYLGIVTRLTAVTRELASGQNVRGALILSVIAGGPAAEAGLHAGDVILRLDGAAVSSGTALRVMTGSLKPGSPHSVTIVRNGRLRTVRVTLGGAAAGAGR